MEALALAVIIGGFMIYLALAELLFKALGIDE